MNISDIAKLAGVSNAAVSRYFNNGYISSEKRERIEKIVKETGYRPSVQAQMLRTKKSMIIGVITPKMASHSIGSVVEGILSVLNETGYHMLLAVTQNDYKKEVEYLKAFNDAQVDGVILVGTVFTKEHKSAMKKMRIPVVVVGQKFPGYACVYHNDYGAIHDMTKKVIAEGRRRIGYIGVMQADKAVGYDRHEGFLDALKAAGLKQENMYIETADSFTMEAGFDAAEEIYRNYKKMDALICATDEIAVGAMKALLAHDVKVPEDVLITGVGDSSLTDIAGHRIYTIHYSYEDSGSLGAKMLLTLINDNSIPLEEVKLGYNLVIR